MKKWIYKAHFVPKWLCFVHKMKVIDILKFIPENYRVHIVRQLEIAEKTGLYPKMSHLCLNVFEEKVKYAEIYSVFEESTTNSADAFVHSKKRRESLCYTEAKVFLSWATKKV